MSLKNSLGVIREALVEPEKLYAAWIASHGDTTTESYGERFHLQELPSKTRLLATASSGDVSGQGTRWWNLLTQLRVAVSWDYEDEDPEDDGSGQNLGADVPNGPAEAVVYRQPRIATIINWSAEPLEDDTDGPARFVLTEVSREKKIVVLRNTELAVPLRPLKN